MKMKRFIALLLTLIALVMPLSSCGYIGTENEVLSAAEEIFMGMDVLCTVLYGEGVPVLDEEAEKYYVAADSEWIKAKGIQSVAQLKEIVSKKFSAVQGELIVNLCINTSKLEEGSVNIPHYKDQTIKDTDEEGNVTGERYTFLVYAGTLPIIKGSNSYDLSTLRVEEIGRNYAVVSLDVTVYPPEGTEGEPLLFEGEKFCLIYEEDSYKLDEVPFITYYVGDGR